MRLKLLVLASIVPVALILVPRHAQAQRTYARCRDQSACIYDRDIADRARERALRIREEARENARFARDRAQARAADRARDNAFRARLRADEQRERARELRDRRRYDRPDHYRVRW